MKVITKKITAGLTVLKRISPFILFETRMNTYNALVMPYFNYCSAVWGNIGIGLADKIQKLQNWAAGILTFSNYKVRSKVLLDVLVNHSPSRVLPTSQVGYHAGKPIESVVYCLNITQIGMCRPEGSGFCGVSV